MSDYTVCINCASDDISYNVVTDSITCHACGVTFPAEPPRHHTKCWVCGAMGEWRTDTETCDDCEGGAK